VGAEASAEQAARVQTLPRHATFTHYRGVWVGFDIGLIGVLATTAVLALRGRPQVVLAATAAATMLLVDAWFDVMTTLIRNVRRCSLSPCNRS